jgi:hypothetical protein
MTLKLLLFFISLLNERVSLLSLYLPIKNTTVIIMQKKECSQAGPVSRSTSR